MRPSSVRRPSVPRARSGVALAATLLATAAAPLVVAATSQASAVVLGATLDRETALIEASGGAQTTVLELTLTPVADAARAARRRPVVVVPVPAAPATQPQRGEAAAVFAELDVATAPRTVASETARHDGTAPRPRVPRFVDYRPHDVSAGDYAALRSRLGAQALTLSAAEARDLRRYAAAGWAFVVLELNAPLTTTTTLRPLRLEFASDRVQYPLATFGADQDGRDRAPLRLYVVGPHRVVASGFGTAHAGWVEDLEPAPSPDVQALLGNERFLTKLRPDEGAASSTGGDLRTEQGVSDRLFRASADYPFESEAGFATAPLPDENAPELPYDGLPGWLWLVVAPLILAIVGVAGLLLRRRG